MTLVALSAPEVDPEERALMLLLSRLVGMPKNRLLAPRVCRLLAGIYEIPGPFYEGSDHDAVNAELTARWQRARKSGGLLPQADLDRFFPAKILPAFAEVIASDPAEFVEAVAAHLGELASGVDEDGEPLLNDDGTPISTLTEVTITKRLAVAKRLTEELDELRKLSRKYGLGDVLDHWRADAVPKLPTARDLKAELRKADRSAPPLPVLRSCLRDMTQKIDRRLRLAGAGRHRGTYTLLRNRVIIVLCALGLRSGTIRRLLVEDFIPELELMPGVVAPALRLRHLKGLNVVREYPIPPMFGRWISEYLSYVRERGYEPAPDQPLLLPKSRSSWRGHRRLGRGMIYVAVVNTLARYAGGRLYSPHTLRHLCQQYAERAGADWLTEHEHDKETLPRPSGIGLPSSVQTFADITLDHALQDIGDRYGDRDSEPARRWWRWITALGLHEYYCGDRGARKGIDLEAVRRAKERVQDLHADIARRRGHITKLEQERERLEQRKIERRRAADRDAETLDDVARFRVLLRLEELNDQMTFVSRQIERELRKLSPVEVELEAARTALEQAATTLKPVPDDVEPVLALPEVHLDADGAVAEEPDERPILRRTFDLREFHYALGGASVISAEQLRRYVRGVSAWTALFDDDGTGKPKGIFRPTPHKCVIAFDDLPLERYPVEVVERLDALMRQPPSGLIARAA
jgi:hypothetical protein